MLPDGTYTGVVDRFEEDAEGTELAVILLEEDDEVVEQVEIPRDDLPSDAGQDAVFEVTVVDEAVSHIEYEPEETKSRSEAAQDRFDRLSQRPPDEPATDSGEDSG